MTTVAFLTVLIGGSWLTSTAMLSERRPWHRLFLMVWGVIVVLMALVGVATIAREAP